MVKINLPKDMLQKEAFRALPAKEKEEYVNNLLKKILELNPKGITIPQIRDATKLTYSTIWHHLERLSGTAQGHKISRGNIDVYYHAGDTNYLNECDNSGAKYVISTVKNSEGKFVCIHEKRQNRLGNHTVCSGIEIPFELIDDFIETFSTVKKSI